MYSKGVFYSTSGPKTLNNNRFTLTYDEEKHHILIFEELEPENILFLTKLTACRTIVLSKSRLIPAALLWTPNSGIMTDF